jgi:1,2-diacylglycerol 3-beta-galactosyltransferase
MKKILILMTEEGGGGHRASAEALRDAFEARYGDRFAVSMVDLWAEYAPPPLNRVPQGYRFLVDDLPWLYRLIYEVGENAQLVEAAMNAAASFLQPFVSRAIRPHDPDLVVSVHPLVQGVTLPVLARLKRRVPFVTVVTDLVTIPPVWFDRRVDLCFVPSDEGHRLALRAGLRADQLRQFGLPIRPAFSQTPRPKAESRQALGMAPNVPAVLIVSGGEGMGRVGQIAKAVAARLAVNARNGESPDGQLTVICGRNQDLQEDLKAHRWPVPTVVKGFVEDIWNWMAASDCIITKAGPGTIAEALALGLPIILSGYVPGQEKGNVPYVLKYGVGVYVEDPWQIGEVVAGWFGSQQEVRQGMADRARQLGRPEATLRIVEEIACLLEYPSLDPAAMPD